MKDVKLLFVLIDSWRLRCELEYNNAQTTPRRRAVEIELTPEQMEKIGLKKVGKKGNDDMFEEIESISIIE